MLTTGLGNWGSGLEVGAYVYTAISIPKPAESEEISIKDLPHYAQPQTLRDRLVELRHDDARPDAVPASSGSPPEPERALHGTCCNPGSSPSALRSLRAGLAIPSHLHSAQSRYSSVSTVSVHNRFRPVYDARPVRSTTRATSAICRGTHGPHRCLRFRKSRAVSAIDAAHVRVLSRYTPCAS